MITYKAMVRVRTSYGSFAQVWAQVQAKNVFDARALLEAQYGAGNVVSAIVKAP